MKATDQAEAQQRAQMLADLTSRGFTIEDVAKVWGSTYKGFFRFLCTEPGGYVHIGEMCPSLQAAEQDLLQYGAQLRDQNELPEILPTMIQPLSNVAV